MEQKRHPFRALRGMNYIFQNQHKKGYVLSSCKRGLKVPIAGLKGYQIVQRLVGEVVPT